MSKKNKRRFSGSGIGSNSIRNDFNPDYTHVKRDLSRIGVLAGFFFTALVVISFILK